MNDGSIWVIFNFFSLLHSILEAPEQVLKRKQDVTAADTVSEEVTPEKKQKIEEANEVDANGADAEVVA